LVTHIPIIYLRKINLRKHFHQGILELLVRVSFRLLFGLGKPTSKE
jgi:hypothetical protein